MGNFIFICPVCRNSFHAEESRIGQTMQCPACKNQVVIRQDPAPAGGPVPPNARSGLQQLNNGHFFSAADYQTLFKQVSDAMVQAQVTISSADPGQGIIHGKARLGLNAFGILVQARFYQADGGIHIQLSAHLADAFDTMGVCSKKIREISQHLAASAGPAVQGPGPAMAFQGFGPPAGVPSGQDHAKLAYTGRLLSILGFFIPLCGIAGLIVSIIAYNFITTNGEPEGKDAAMLGIILGATATFVNMIIILCIL